MENEAVLDPETVATLTALQAQAGPTVDVLGDLAGIFERDAGRYLVEIAASWGNADEQACRRMIHTLKGAALSVGAQRVASTCRAIEGRAELGQLVDEVEVLAEAVTGAVAALRALASGGAASSA